MRGLGRSLSRAELARRRAELRATGWGLAGGAPQVS